MYASQVHGSAWVGMYLSQMHATTVAAVGVCQVDNTVRENKNRNMLLYAGDWSGALTSPLSAFVRSGRDIHTIY